MELEINKNKFRDNLEFSPAFSMTSHSRCVTRLKQFDVLISKWTFPNMVACYGISMQNSRKDWNIPQLEKIRRLLLIHE